MDNINTSALDTVAATAPQQEDKALTLASLPPEEQQKILNFIPKIDITDSSSIIQYGATAQNKIASFSDATIKNLRTKDVGETGELLVSLVGEIQGFGKAAEKKGLFQSIKSRLNKTKAEYDKVSVNIDKITGALEDHQRTLMKDVAVLDVMYKTNEEYFKEVSMYIIAGKEKLNQINTVDLPALQAAARASNDQADVQKVQDLQNFINRFEKKLHDLLVTRTIALQTAPQIRIQQNNNTQLADKIQASIVHTIPLWKGQVVMALTQQNASQALKAQQQVSDITNTMLLKNSEQLKQNSIGIAKESERAIVDIETLQKTNQNLIDTINEVISIQKDGSIKRAESEKQLQIMEQQLKTVVLNSATGAAPTNIVEATQNVQASAELTM